MSDQHCSNGPFALQQPCSTCEHLEGLLVSVNDGEALYRCPRCVHRITLFEAASRPLELLVVQTISACRLTWAEEPAVMLEFRHIVIGALEQAEATVEA